jgi:hypothetical protein
MTPTIIIVSPSMRLMDASETVSLRALFFSLDGMHGGRTWSDVSSQVQGIADKALVSGFALDNDHVWIGGRLGALIATDTAQKQ